MIRGTIWRAIAGFLLLPAMLAPAAAQEVIRSFDTHVTLRADLSAEVVETIAVQVEGIDIRRGLMRDISTTLINDDGQRQVSALEALSVTRNGQPEPFSVSSIRDGKRVTIGDADVLLNRGLHRYEIRYTMDRVGRLFADHDEIYWNATGNFWQFPIEAASATIVLPSGARITKLAAFTGAQGETGQDARGERLSDNVARFFLTHPLAAREGLSVAVAFEKGVLTGPQGVDAARHWLSDNRSLIVPAGLVALVLLYNGLAWTAVGRDPAKGVIFPRFHPPKDFSPALTHYVHRMGWRNSGWAAFSAALVSLAVKGLVELSGDKSNTEIKLTARSPDRRLPGGEAVIFDYLRKNAPVTIDSATGPQLAITRAAFVGAIEGENRRVYFNNHAVFTVMGILLGLAALGILFWMGLLEPLVLVIGLFVLPFLAFFVMSLRGLWQGPLIGRLISLGVGAIILFNFGGLLIDLLGALTWSSSTIAALSIVAVTAVFGVLMRAPTVHGRKVMDEIDGFRMYLETAEKERLNFRDEPELTVKRFEAILPYAMALGVEKPWSERFQNELQRHAVADAEGGYAPHWYGGRPIEPGRLASTMGGVATGLSAAMVAAQPSSSSSSGFSSGGGGGGFSGGGSGGGGGGGW